MAVKWKNFEPQTMLDNGKEIITTDSTLMCYMSGGEIFLPSIYGKDDPKGELIRAALERLLPDCDASACDRLINGLENIGAQMGMDQVEGWDVHKLNKDLIEMLRTDCMATAEKINTSSLARWTEENKKFVSIMGDAVLNLAYTVMIWHCTTVAAEAKAVTDAAGNTGGQGGAGSKLQEVLDLADNYTLSEDTFYNHILDRHGSGSIYGSKSHFNIDFDIRGGIDSTLKGDNFVVRPNTGGREGYIFEQTFTNPIGISNKGKTLYTLKVAINEFGDVITAFPKK